MLSNYIHAVNEQVFQEQTGILTAVNGSVVEASGCEVRVGELVEIEHALNKTKMLAEVVGLKDNKILLMPYGTTLGLCLNSRIKPVNKEPTINVGYELLGRVIDATGNTIDDGEALELSESVKLHEKPINPLSRAMIDQQLETNVKAVDGFLPLGKGQKIGVFAGSGVGKSTLLGMITQHAKVDVVVIALIGERGREVIEFINDTLGPSGLKKAVIVVATSEQPATMKKQAAISATAIAEWFRHQGKDVLLIMDSITRFAMAQREIGISAGESIGARGYPSSVYSEIPTLVERAGAFKDGGSITAIYTVLVEGDDMNEPIADHMRSILDGHVVLSRELAAIGHFPAIDILNSVSRLFGKLFTVEQKKKISTLRELLSVYFEAKDIVELGAYESGNDEKIDLALRLKDELFSLVRQNTEEKVSIEQLWPEIDKLLEQIPYE